MQDDAAPHRTHERSSPRYDLNMKSGAVFINAGVTPSVPTAIQMLATIISNEQKYKRDDAN
jgi:hypothetical protein